MRRHSTLTKSRKLFLFLFFVAFAASMSLANGQDPNVKGNTTATTPSMAAATAKKLIDSLVTTNEMPQVFKSRSGYRNPVFPKNFDWKEYARVREIIEKLEQHLEQNADEVWPILVEHMCDPGYSYTVDAYDSAYNYSRGYVCYALARSWVNRAYIGLMPMERPLYHYQAPNSMDPKSLQKWCRARSNKRLYEIQIEAGEWAISIIPKESEMDKEDQERATVDIQKRIAKIRETKKPIPGEFFRTDVICPYTEEQAAKFRKPNEEELASKLRQLCQ